MVFLFLNYFLGGYDTNLPGQSIGPFQDGLIWQVGEGTKQRRR